MTNSLTAVGHESFVSLTTFRASGAPVSTPVWIGHDGGEAEDDGDLLVLTPADSGKVKRLRSNPLVELRPCDRRGRVQEGAPMVRAVVEILDSPAGVDAVREVMRRKYGAEYLVFMVIEAIVRRNRHTERVGLLLRPMGAGEYPSNGDGSAGQSAAGGAATKEIT
jgi:PPOX class probable F420-dependent enzyme